MQIVPVTDENRDLFADMLYEPVPLKGEKYVSMGVLEGETPCAAVIASVTGSMAHIHSFYVEPSHRRLGMGRRVMEQLISYAKKMKLELMTVDFMYSDEGAEEFFLSEGFLLTGESPLYEMSVREMMEYDKPEALKKHYPAWKLLKFADISADRMHTIHTFLDKMDFPSEILNMPTFDEDLSIVVFDSGNNIQAVMICTSTPEEIMVEFMGVTDKHPEILLMLLGNLYDELSRDINGDRTFCFQQRRGNAVELVEKLLDMELEPADFPVFGVLAL